MTKRSMLPVAAFISVLLIAPSASARPATPLASDGRASAGMLGPVRQLAPPDGVQGIDVSHWNDRIRWRKVSRDGIEFAIAKATQGTSYEDPRYDANHAHARQEGVAFTAYEFADPDSGARDPIKDAAHFVKVASLKPSDLVPVLDLEQTGGLSRGDLLTWTEKWCNEVERLLRVRPLVYTSPSFWTDRVKDSTSLAESGTRLWVAHWFVHAPTVPADNWDGAGWRIWQWSDRGHVDGIAGRVDMDVLSGVPIDDLLMKNA